MTRAIFHYDSSLSRLANLKFPIIFHYDRFDENLFSIRHISIINPFFFEAEFSVITGKLRSFGDYIRLQQSGGDT
jgi:hypothetical protein